MPGRDREREGNQENKPPKDQCNEKEKKWVLKGEKRGLLWKFALCVVKKKINKDHIWHSHHEHIIELLSLGTGSFKRGG